MQSENVTCREWSHEYCLSEGKIMVQLDFDELTPRKHLVFGDHVRDLCRCKGGVAKNTETSLAKHTHSLELAFVD